MSNPKNTKSLVYKSQQDANVTEFILSDNCLHQQPHENKNRSTRHPQHTQISSNSSMIAADNSMATYIIHYSIELIAFSAEYTLFNNCNFNPVYRYSLSVNLTLSVTV